MKKRVIIAAVILLVLGLLLCRGEVVKGSIIEFKDNAVIVASEDGKKVVRVEEYRTYVPADEEWAVGDRVAIRSSTPFRKMSLHRLAE